MSCEPNIAWEEPIPLFPLPNCVLLPGAILPLHVFEPRYRCLMRDLLARKPASRALAIALLREGHEDLILTNHAPIHPVVGVGTFLEHQELPDGRFNLLLQGRARARITVEDTTGRYRKAILTPCESLPLPKDDGTAAARASLRRLLEQAAALRLWPVEATEGFFDAFPSVAQLVDVLAFHLIPVDCILFKQQLLEEADVTKRVELVCRWLEQVIATQRYAESNRPDGSTWPPPCSPN